MESYFNRVVNKYALSSHILFGFKVVSATWEAKTQQYHITVENVSTGHTSTATAKILISAIGFLDEPKNPDIPGLSDFEGTLFHAARWKAVDLSGKRVAVLGNGSSAWVILLFLSFE